MKKKIAMCMMAALCLGSGMTAYAAPETMADGMVFDAEYYAQNNPDVAAVLGTDREALYQHYVTHGMHEGRSAHNGNGLSEHITEHKPLVIGPPEVPEGEDPITFADYEGYHVEDENGVSHYVVKEITCNGMISVSTDDPIYPVYDGFGCYTAVEISTLSDDQLLHYLTTESDLDVDALAWWVATDYDDATKFALLDSAESTGTASSMWIIQSQIAPELKTQYFRTHNLGHNSAEVLQWWFDNVGNKLTTEQTGQMDGCNYEAFRSMTLPGLDTTEYVKVGDVGYSIAKEDLTKAIEEGKIIHSQTTGYMMGEPFIIDDYYASTPDIGYKMWRW